MINCSFINVSWFLKLTFKKAVNKLVDSDRTAPLYKIGIVSIVSFVTKKCASSHSFQAVN